MMRVAMILALLPLPALSATWTCRVDDGFFGHGPLFDAAGSTLVLTQMSDAAAVLTWKNLTVTLEQSADPEVPPLPFAGRDANGVAYAMSFQPGGRLILSARPGGIEFALFATCPETPTEDP